MLNKVVMKNFMCFGEKEIDFSSGVTTISAMNGKGKTTVATAILWGLFNKNYELKDNPVVRKNDITDKSDVEVELTFDDVTFRKVQKRKRNANNPDEYADSNSYYVNDVPVTMKEYNERIGKDVKTLLMGSSINAFLSEKADVLRAYLFSHVENITDIDVAKATTGMDELVALLEKYNLEEVKAMNKKVVSDTTKDLVILGGQIKEKEHDIEVASAVNVSELELAKAEIGRQITEIETKIEDSEKLLAEKQKKTDSIMELKFKLSDMERKANADVANLKREYENSVTDLKRNYQRTELEIRQHTERMNNVSASIERQLTKVKELQQKWKTEKDRTLDDTSLVCPYCGQEYPEDKKAAMKEKFETNKASELAAITKEGEFENKNLIKLRQDLQDEGDIIQGLNNSLAELEKDIKTAQHKAEDIVLVDVTTTDKYIKLKAEIDSKEKELAEELSLSDIRLELRSKLNELKSEHDRLSGEIAKSSTAEFEARLDELVNSGHEMEQKKADAEKILSLVDDLEKVKNQALSDKVNSMFNIVKFKLFEFAKNGTYKNVCIPTIDGKSLLDNSSNKALRIIGKIDICNTIQHLENFNLPIILDDGEALDAENRNKVSALTDRQVIILRVSDDTELTKN